MKIISLSIFLFALSAISIGQIHSDSLDIEIITECDFGIEVDDLGDIITDPISSMPKFAVSYDSIQSFIKYELNKIRPKNDISGISYVQFIVAEDGTIEDVTTIKGFDDSCDKAAIEVVKKLPKFIPALDGDGQPIRTRMVLPIRFEF